MLSVNHQCLSGGGRSSSRGAPTTARSRQYGEEFALRCNTMYRMAIEVQRQLRDRTVAFELDPEELDRARAGRTSITNSAGL